MAEIEWSPWPKVRLKSLIWLLSLIGILGLFWLWKGASPDPAFHVKEVALRKKIGHFRFDYLAYYFGCLGFYLFPLHLLFLKKIYRSKGALIGAISGFIFLLLFRPTVNFFHNYDNLGLFQRLARLIPNVHFEYIFMDNCYLGWSQ